MKPETVKIDDVEYVRADSIKAPSGKIRIIILQRGWVAVGYFKADEGGQCFLNNAYIIRRWGTKNGLGEIALNGPTASTVLDKIGRMQFHELTIISTIECMEEKWQPKLL